MWIFRLVLVVGLLVCFGLAGYLAYIIFNVSDTGKVLSIIYLAFVTIFFLEVSLPPFTKMWRAKNIREKI